MANPPDRTMLSRLVDAYDRDFGGEPRLWATPSSMRSKDQLFDAIDDSGYRAVIKDGSIYLLDPNGSAGRD